MWTDGRGELMSHPRCECGRPGKVWVFFTQFWAGNRVAQGQALYSSLPLCLPCLREFGELEKPGTWSQRRIVEGEGQEPEEGANDS